jgi:hypothetical protein
MQAAVGFSQQHHCLNSVTLFAHAASQVVLFEQAPIVLIAVLDGFNRS